jgi:hypothetical protein
MLSHTQEENRRLHRYGSLLIGLVALVTVLAPLRAGSTQQQETPPPPRPATANTPARAPLPASTINNQRTPFPAGTTNTQRAPLPATNNNARRTAVPARPMPANGTNISSALSNLFAPNRGAAAATAASQPATNGAASRPVMTKTAAPVASARNLTSPTRVASLVGSQPSGRAVPSRTFVGHPGPPGSTETQNRNGNIVRTAADGSVIDVHSPKNGMLIHHGLDGSRQIIVDRPDHSRVVATSRGVQYVQHPYTFGGRSYDHRTFYVQGHLFHQLYRPYTYAGTTLDVYATSRFYEPKFYQWAASRFNTPQPFAWGYTANPPPWFAYYRGYFTPDSAYTNPSVWLADYVLASSLETTYRTERPASGGSAADGAAAITPQVKQMVADEVDRQVKQEAVEAQDNAQHRDPAPGAGGVVQELGDGQTHVYVVGSDLDLVDPTGRRCMISEGDVVQVVGGPQASTSTASAVVLASKGGVECGRAAQVEIALADLQEMQNHMRETIDQGMATTKAAKGVASVTPAFAASVPPADAEAAKEIDQQKQIAEAADG